MTGSSQQDHNFLDLDPEVLLTPFQVVTNWHVITGAPSCGKTTLIDLLAESGFQTVPEIAHQHIESKLASGLTLDEIFKNRIVLQRELIDLQIEAEKGLVAGKLIFLDRALPDSLSFNRFVGRDPNEFLLDCFTHRYASVFILDPLPYDADGIRDFDAPYVEFIDEWITQDYQTLGYDVVRVPVLSPRERLAFVLARITGGS